MENKDVVSTKKMTQELIVGWFLWGIPLGILYSVVYSLLANSMESMTMSAVIAIILQGITVFFIWRLSISSSFKKKTIASEDVPKVMKNLIIFTIIICFINGIFNFSKVNKIIDEMIDTNYQLKYYESMMSYLYDDEQMEEYNAQKEEIIKEAKNQCYIYLAILEIGLTIVYLAVLPLEKKAILKYVNDI